MKVDALKGMAIKKFPKILTISLLRFDMNYETFQPMKLNDKFKFPLELHLNEYMTDDSKQKGEDIDYELLSCIIHIGNVGGGHYKAYIRDYENEGTWDFSLYDKEDRKEAEQKEKEKEEKKAKDKPTENINSDDWEEDGILPGMIAPPEENKEEENEQIDYNGDFPLPYKNSELGKNWYEFNDSYVRPIVAGRLESQFGNGKSNQNAYILMYKRKGDNENQKYEDIPAYWVNAIKEQNEKAEEERAAYEKERNMLEIFLQPQMLFKIDINKEVSYVDQKDTEEQGVKIKFSFDTTVREVKILIRRELALGEDTEFEAFET
jgi:hypothetical protein